MMLNLAKSIDSPWATTALKRLASGLTPSLATMSSTTYLVVPPDFGSTWLRNRFQPDKLPIRMLSPHSNRLCSGGNRRVQAQTATITSACLPRVILIFFHDLIGSQMCASAQMSS
jgi:hypothetical protein